MYKLIMTWNIVPSHEKEFLDFLMHEFTPSLQKLGLQPTDAWLTVYGQGPQVMTGGVVDELDEMKALLESDDWDELESKLLGLVADYERKIVRAEGGFQL